MYASTMSVVPSSVDLPVFIEFVNKFVNSVA